MFTKKPASGLRNIKITPNNTYAVHVSWVYLGTFKTKEKAIEVRNERRAKMGLPELGDNE